MTVRSSSRRYVDILRFPGDPEPIKYLQGRGTWTSGADKMVLFIVHCGVIVCEDRSRVDYFFRNHMFLQSRTSDTGLVSQILYLNAVEQLASLTPVCTYY
jgi:hypothetical protein